MQPYKLKNMNVIFLILPTGCNGTRQRHRHVQDDLCVLDHVKTDHAFGAQAIQDLAQRAVTSVSSTSAVELVWPKFSLFDSTVL